MLSLTVRRCDAHFSGYGKDGFTVGNQPQHIVQRGLPR
jgi:hypothetical protein